jgi:hypothetical protein
MGQNRPPALQKKFGKTVPRPAPTPPRQPLQLPPNFRDVTAEKIGTVTGIVGAAGAKATKPG